MTAIEPNYSTSTTSVQKINTGTSFTHVYPELSHQTISNTFLPDDFPYDGLMNVFIAEDKVDAYFKLPKDLPLKKIQQVNKVRQKIKNRLRFRNADRSVLITCKEIFQLIEASTWLVGGDLRKDILDRAWRLENLQILAPLEKLLAWFPEESPSYTIYDIDFLLALLKQQPAEAVETVIEYLTNKLEQNADDHHCDETRNSLDAHPLFHIDASGTQVDTNAQVITYQNENLKIDVTFAEHIENRALVTTQNIFLNITSLIQEPFNETQENLALIPESQNGGGLQAIIDDGGKIARICSSNYMAVFKVLSLSIEMYRDPEKIDVQLIRNLLARCRHKTSMAHGLFDFMQRDLEKHHSMNLIPAVAFAFNLSALLLDHPGKATQDHLKGLWLLMRQHFNSENVSLLGVFLKSTEVMPFKMLRALLEIQQAFALNEMPEKRPITPSALFLTRHDNRPALISFFGTNTLLATWQFEDSLKLIYNYSKQYSHNPASVQLTTIAHILQVFTYNFSFISEPTSAIKKYRTHLSLDVNVLQELAHKYLLLPKKELQFLGYVLLFFCFDLNATPERLSELLIYLPYGLSSTTIVGNKNLIDRIEAYVLQFMPTLLPIVHKKLLHSPDLTYENADLALSNQTQWLCRLAELHIPALWDPLIQAWKTLHLTSENIPSNFLLFFNHFIPLHIKGALQLLDFQVQALPSVTETHLLLVHESLTTLFQLQLKNHLVPLNTLLSKIFSKCSNLAYWKTDYTAYIQGLLKLGSYDLALSLLVQGTQENLLDPFCEDTFTFWLEFCYQIYCKKGFLAALNLWKQGHRLCIWQTNATINGIYRGFLIDFAESLQAYTVKHDDLIPEILNLLSDTYQDENNARIQQIKSTYRQKLEAITDAENQIFNTLKAFEHKLKLPDAQNKEQLHLIEAKRLVKILLNSLRNKKRLSESLNCLKRLFCNTRFKQLWKDQENEFLDEVTKVFKAASHPKLLTQNLPSIFSIIESIFQWMGSLSYETIKGPSTSSLIDFLIKLFRLPGSFNVSLDQAQVMQALPILLEFFNKQRQYEKMCVFIFALSKHIPLLQRFPAELFLNWISDPLQKTLSNSSSNLSLQKDFRTLLKEIEFITPNLSLFAQIGKIVEILINFKAFDETSKWISLLCNMYQRPSIQNDTRSTSLIFELSISFYQEEQFQQASDLLQALNHHYAPIQHSLYKTLVKFSEDFLKLHPSLFTKILLSQNDLNLPTVNLATKVYTLVRSLPINSLDTFQLIRSPMILLDSSMKIALTNAFSHTASINYRKDLWALYLHKETQLTSLPITERRVALKWIKCWQSAMKVLNCICKQISPKELPTYITDFEEQLDRLLDPKSQLSQALDGTQVEKQKIFKTILTLGFEVLTNTNSQKKFFEQLVELRTGLFEGVEPLEDALFLSIDRPFFTHLVTSKDNEWYQIALAFLVKRLLKKDFNQILQIIESVKLVAKNSHFFNEELTLKMLKDVLILFQKMNPPYETKLEIYKILMTHPQRKQLMAPVLSPIEKNKLQELKQNCVHFFLLVILSISMIYAAISLIFYGDSTKKLLQ